MPKLLLMVFTHKKEPYVIDLSQNMETREMLTLKQLLLVTKPSLTPELSSPMLKNNSDKLKLNLPQFKLE